MDLTLISAHPDERRIQAGFVVPGIRPALNLRSAPAFAGAERRFY